LAQLLDQLPYLLGALTVSGEYSGRGGTRIIGLVGLGGAFGERDAMDTKGGRVVTEEDQREKEMIWSSGELITNSTARVNCKGDCVMESAEMRH
jgi:hypothetical protein